MKLEIYRKPKQKGNQKLKKIKKNKLIREEMYLAIHSTERNKMRNLYSTCK